MLKKGFKLVFLLTIYMLFCSRIYKESSTNNTKKIDTQVPIKTSIHYPRKSQEQTIGSLAIKKINLKENLYSIHSKKNNVNENITILKESIEPDKENSIFYLAAHSGEGKIAYFEQLDKLKEKEEIILIYKNKNYIYQIKDIWEQEKNGYINIYKEKQNQLILTTCSPNNKNKQLIINSILKESI